jgi:hypothetical protein
MTKMRAAELELKEEAAKERLAIYESGNLKVLAWMVRVITHPDILRSILNCNVQLRY